MIYDPTRVLLFFAKKIPPPNFLRPYLKLFQLILYNYYKKFEQKSAPIFLCITFFNVSKLFINTKNYISKSTKK